jgi:DNA-binding transcriptional LysR family regulator
MRTFARVVEAGSFTKAADSLQLPKASVTKLVQSLETHLGVKLLQRTTRRVAVTADGASYYDKATRLLKDLGDIDDSFGAAHSAPRGHLRVDMGSSVASRIIVPALPDFVARYPGIQLDIGVSDRHVDLIGDNVDCVIRGGAITDLSMVARQVGQAAWVTCATPDYLARHGTPRRPSDLEHGHQVVSYLSARSGRAMPMHFARGGEKLEIRARHAVGVNESNAHFEAALAGLGIIQTFDYLARAHLDSGALVPILKTWQSAPYPFHVVFPPNRHLSQRARVFIDWVAERFATPP